MKIKKKTVSTFYEVIGKYTLYFILPVDSHLEQEIAKDFHL